MYDPISRQAAIDVVKGWFKKVSLNPEGCIDELIHMPSESEEPSTDKIIDALEAHKETVIYMIGRCGFTQGLDKAIEIIKELQEEEDANSN